MQERSDPYLMTNEVDITIMVPCLNEETHVGSTLKTIEAAMGSLGCSYEVIVADDGSTDRTAAVVEDFIKANPQIPARLYRNPCNLGVARTFVDMAFRGRGKYYRTVGGNDMESIETLIAIFSKMGEADIIVPYPRALETKSLPRRFVSRTFTMLVNTVTGYSLNYYNGFPLYRRFHVIRWAPYNYGFSCQGDLITTLLDQGASCLEVPVTASHRTKERAFSALRFQDFVSAGHTLFEMMLRRSRHLLFERKRPKLPILYE
ncbi:MAG TPA: glycosyltransferase family 2 protein [Chthoniobacterales bacterium]|nr:glycosyltransferase family 2 protein [Chthoniobacterales bacterium]